MQVFWIKKKDNKNILEKADIPIPTPKDDEVLVKHRAIGVNFLDYEYLNGSEPLLHSPMIPGIEAACIVEACGKDVANFTKGQRVGYATVLGGAYAEYRTIKAHNLFPIPDPITDEAAALNMVKGMTAHFLMRRTFFLRQGMSIMIHGAAGNIGKLMIRLAREYKVNVIATVGSDDNKKIVQDLGIKTVFNYNKEDFLKAGQVHVVYDFVGGAMIEKSLPALLPFGLAVSAASYYSKAQSVDPALLSSHSLFLTAPKLNQYKQDKPELMMSIMEVFALICDGVFPAVADKKYKFNEIPEATEDLASMKPSSKVILLD